MPRPVSPTFTCTFPVQVNAGDAAVLERRFEQARLLYNALLQEARNRLAQLKAHPSYLSAMEAKRAWHAQGKRMVRELGPEEKWPSKLKAQRARDLNTIGGQFGEARSLCAFSEYSLHTFATNFRKRASHLGLFGESLDTHVVQKLASRAFKACEGVVTLKRGAPRFKSFTQPLGSVEGKSNEAGLMFKAQDATLRWNGLKLSLLYDESDAYHLQAFGSRCKYVRLLRKVIKGKVRWYAQLVLEGSTLQKRSGTVASGAVVGLDIGPSSLAAVSDDTALLTPFCAELNRNDRHVRRLSRRLDRQRRAGNPDNYTPDGQVKRGVTLTWVSSNGYRQTRSALAEHARRLAEHRKSLHGRLTNDLLELGTVFRTEQLSMKAWQKIFGRSVGRNAPGMFHTLLNRKAERAGGQLQWINPFSTALSQHCICGAKKKKPLSQRVHACRCEADGLQRDLLSAYLARHTNLNTVDWKDVQMSFPGVEALLRLAHRQATAVQTTSGRPRSSHLSRGRSRSVIRLEGSTLRLPTEAHPVGEVKQTDGTPRL